VYLTARKLACVVQIKKRAAAPFCARITLNVDFNEAQFIITFSKIALPC
jgi:hypothetical protein